MFNAQHAALLPQGRPESWSTGRQTSPITGQAAKATMDSRGQLTNGFTDAFADALTRQRDQALVTKAIRAKALRAKDATKRAATAEVAGSAVAQADQARTSRAGERTNPTHYPRSSARAVQARAHDRADDRSLERGLERRADQNRNIKDFHEFARFSPNVLAFLLADSPMGGLGTEAFTDPALTGVDGVNTNLDIGTLNSSSPTSQAATTPDEDAGTQLLSTAATPDRSGNPAIADLTSGDHADAQGNLGDGAIPGEQSDPDPLTNNGDLVGIADPATDDRLGSQTLDPFALTGGYGAHLLSGTSLGQSATTTATAPNGLGADQSTMPADGAVNGQPLGVGDQQAGIPTTLTDRSGADSLPAGGLYDLNASSPFTTTSSEGPGQAVGDSIDAGLGETSQIQSIQDLPGTSPSGNSQQSSLAQGAGTLLSDTAMSLTPEQVVPTTNVMADSPGDGLVVGMAGATASDAPTLPTASVQTTASGDPTTPASPSSAYEDPSLTSENNQDAGRSGETTARSGIGGLADQPSDSTTDSTTTATPGTSADAATSATRTAAGMTGTSQAPGSFTVNPTPNPQANTSGQPLPNGQFYQPLSPAQLMNGAIRLLRQRGNGSYVTDITLHPKELGQVRLRVEVNGSRVNLQMQAESAQTRSLLDANMADLRQALADAGLEGGQMDIGHGDPDQADNRDRSRGSNDEDYVAIDDQQLTQAARLTDYISTTGVNTLV